MESNTSQNISSIEKNQEEPLPQTQLQDEQITPETLQHFNRICVEATEVMNEYKTQSIALKQEIAGMVSIYQKSTANNTDAVPVEKIISITNEYQQGMKQANREYNHLAQQLRGEEKERDQIVFQIKDCFDKLQRMEVRIKEKKRKEHQQKILKQNKQSLETLTLNNSPQNAEQSKNQPQISRQNENKNEQNKQL